jgi:hypothetical protein
LACALAVGRLKQLLGQLCGLAQALIKFQYGAGAHLEIHSQISVELKLNGLIKRHATTSAAFDSAKTSRYNGFPRAVEF